MRTRKVKLDKLPANTVYDRIFKYYIEDNIILSEADQKVLDRIEAAFGIMSNEFASREQVRKKLTRIYSISDRTARKDVEAAINLYFDPKKNNKEIKRAMLEEYQMRILNKAMNMDPPNLEVATRAIANLVKITGIEQKDPLDLSNITFPEYVVREIDTEIKQELPADWRELLAREKAKMEQKLINTEEPITEDIDHEEIQ